MAFGSKPSEYGNAMTTDGAYRLHKFHAVDPPEKAWKQFSTLFDLTPLKMSDNTGAIENHTWVAGACVFAQVSLDGNAHKHTEHHLSKSGDLLFVHHYLLGGADGRSGNAPYRMRPGMMIFHDYGRPFEGIQTPSVIQSVYIPHAMIGYSPEQMPAQITFDQQSPHGAALFAAFEALMPELLNGAEFLEKERSEYFVDLVRAALPQAGAPKPLSAKLQLHIEDRLSDPGLNVEALQAAFQLSKAQVFEEMELHGGFDTYLTSRRVYRAVFELSGQPSNRENLGAAASRWGFASEADLKRAVAMQYRADIETMFDA